MAYQNFNTLPVQFPPNFSFTSSSKPSWKSNSQKVIKPNSRQVVQIQRQNDAGNDFLNVFGCKNDDKYVL